MRALVGAVILALLIACTSEQTPVQVPQRTGRLVDVAGLLGAPERERVQSKLASSEILSPCQFFVVVVPALRGEPIEQFAQRVAEAWDLGGPQYSNAALIVVSVKEGEFRVQVREALFDAMAGGKVAHVTKEILAPSFSSSDYAGGLIRAMQFIESEVQSKPRTVGERREERRPNSADTVRSALRAPHGARHRERKDFPTAATAAVLD
jgi:uncharacterized protein